MACDEALYRQYLSGDDEGLNALMKKYGDSLTLYIDGYLHDVHEAEELMLDVFAYLFTKKPRIRDGGFKAYLYKAARRSAVHRLRPAGAAGGGGKIVHIPIITEKITEYPLLESCFLAALNFFDNFFEKFLKNR